MFILPHLLTCTKYLIVLFFMFMFVFDKPPKQPRRSKKLNPAAGTEANVYKYKASRSYFCGIDSDRLGYRGPVLFNKRGVIMVLKQLKG